jgi:hypothetical protein
LGEGVAEEGLEAGVEAEVGGFADGRGVGVLPEPLEVVGGLDRVLGRVAWWWGYELVGVGDLCAGGRRSDEEEGESGELDGCAHGVGGTSERQMRGSFTAFRMTAKNQQRQEQQRVQLQQQVRREEQQQVQRQKQIPAG